MSKKFWAIGVFNGLIWLTVVIAACSGGGGTSGTYADRMQIYEDAQRRNACYYIDGYPDSLNCVHMPAAASAAPTVPPAP
jgi:hypothetical protein